MQMRSILLLFQMLAATLASGQTLTNRELRELDSIMTANLLKRDKPTADRFSEIIVLVVKTDSSGQVSSMNILSDQKEPGATCELLQRTNLELFAGWRSRKAVNKYILMPIYSFGYQQKDNYADTMFSDLLRRSQRPFGVRSENGSIITVSPLIYSPPYERYKDDHMPGKFILIDSVRKN